MGFVFSITGIKQEGICSEWLSGFAKSPDSQKVEFNACLRQSVKVFVCLCICVIDIEAFHATFCRKCPGTGSSLNLEQITAVFLDCIN